MADRVAVSYAVISRRLGETSKLLLVIHTHVEITGDMIAIRMISARRPTGKEARQYREQVQS